MARRDYVFVLDVLRTSRTNTSLKRGKPPRENKKQSFDMAVPHLCVKYGSRQTGSSAKDHFNYICRLEAKAKDDLVFVSHQNYPKWASNPADFHQAADLYERANARLYREIVVALPRELSRDRQLGLVTKWAESEIGKSHPFTIAVHSPLALDGKPNTHAHIMFSDRTLDGVDRDPKLFFKRANSQNPELGGAAKSKDWNRKQKVVEIRQCWEKVHNLALERAGVGEAAISMKSLKDQGIDRLPEPKLGVVQTSMLRQGKDNENTLLVKALRSVRNIESSLGGVQKEITSTIKDLAREVVLKQQSFELVSAKEVKRSVTEQKMTIYTELRQVEQARFSLGLIKHPSGKEFYPPTNTNSLIEWQGKTEKEYQKLVEELAAAKRYEKELAVLGEQQVKVVSGKSIADVDSLCDRSGFLQKVSKARTRILAKDKSSYHLGLHLEPPQPPQPP